MHTTEIPKTVFILGAGSSHSLGFPLGDQLKARLITHLTPGNNVFEALKFSGFTEAQVHGFARQLKRAEYDTIDQHLNHINDPLTREIGKRAVAYVIRSGENDDALFHTDKRAKHWYKILADHLANYPAHVSSDQFSFISFNYDRSLTHYLFETLLSRNFEQAHLKGFLGEANFYQIHGHVGELPWQLEKGGDSKSYYQYGASLSAQDLGGHIPQILLTDDVTDMGLRLARITGKAEVVVFIGFGFHQSNMRKLPFADSGSPAGKKKNFFSINTAPPPAGLLPMGNPILHRQGQVDNVIKEFFDDLVSGDLLRFEYAPLKGRIVK